MDKWKTEGVSLLMNVLKLWEPLSPWLSIIAYKSPDGWECNLNILLILAGLQHTSLHTIVALSLPFPGLCLSWIQIYQGTSTRSLSWSSIARIQHWNVFFHSVIWTLRHQFGLHHTCAGIWWHRCFYCGTGKQIVHHSCAHGHKSLNIHVYVHILYQF